MSWRQPEAHRIDNIRWVRGGGRERERGAICRAIGSWHAILSRQTSTLVINAGLGWRAGVGSWRWVFGDDSRANYRVVGPRQWRMIWEIPRMDSRWLRCWRSLENVARLLFCNGMEMIIGNNKYWDEKFQWTHFCVDLKKYKIIYNYHMKSGNWNENIEIEIMIEIVFFRVRIYRRNFNEILYEYS